MKATSGLRSRGHCDSSNALLTNFALVTFMLGVGGVGPGALGRGGGAGLGHAPRHLDRNIAVVGRVIEGIERLSSLPRGTEALGFYKSESQNVPIASVRLGSDIHAGERQAFQVMDTNSATFAAYLTARANRKDDFFIRPAGGADLCNVQVPVRRKPA